MNRPLLRALLSSAALAAAIALGGCNPDIVPSGRAQAPLSEKTLAEIASKNMEKDSPILVRIFKEESEMEVWKQNRDGEFALLKTYPICRWSGQLGPKKKEGDRQAPEGFYTITPGQMNPNSSYYLAFNTGFPNAYDRSHGYTGSELMVHGDCSSRGCYAMTDEQIQEIYALARESFFGGQKAFQLQAYPFRMTAMNMAKHRNNPHFAFWKMIKEGYDDFEATHHEPKVNVCEKRYVFDAAPPDNASRPLAFTARGKCPVYQLDKTVAEAVLEHRRKEQIKMAEYIADNVATVPIQNGVDGGMNPVFVAKLSTHTEFDNAGRMYEVAGNSMAPGALPRTPNPPSTAQKKSQVAQLSKPMVTASVPVPHPAPRAKEGESPAEQKPTTIASLLGNLFSGNKAQAEEPTTAESETTGSQRSNTTLAAKPKHSATTRVAAAPVMLHPKPKKPAAAQAVAASAPAQPAKPPEASASPWPTTERPKTVASSSPWPAPARPKVASASPWPVATPANSVPPVKPKPATAAKNAPVPRTQQAAKPEKPPTVEMRTAYAPAANNGHLLSGAQPVVPAGSFSALR